MHPLLLAYYISIASLFANARPAPKAVLHSGVMGNNTLCSPHMDVYIPSYILLLLIGAVSQAGYALRRTQAKKAPFVLALAGALMVLLSAWLERDVLLGSGQFFLLCLLWRLRSDSTAKPS